MKTGVELIADERRRQIEQEGWTPAHDDEHGAGELAIAAACYAASGSNAAVYRSPTADDVADDPDTILVDAWPWDPEWDKRGKGGRLRDLIKAGALIAAEIDRMQRVEASDDTD